MRGGQHVLWIERGIRGGGLEGLRGVDFFEIVYCCGGGDDCYGGYCDEEMIWSHRQWRGADIDCCCCCCHWRGRIRQLFDRFPLLWIGRCAVT